MAIKNFKSEQYSDLYKRNQLLFKSENEIKDALKTDPKTRSLLIPVSFYEKANWTTDDGSIGPGYKSYMEFIEAGTYISYPQLCLEEVHGMCAQGEPEVTLPKQLEYLKDYATEENTSIVDLELKCVETLFKFGCGLLLTEIEEGIPTVDEIFKFKVYPGNKIIDFSTSIENGNETFNWILLDTTKRSFDYTTKTYSLLPLYRLLAIDADGNYYSAEFPQSMWSTFNILKPSSKYAVYPNVRGLVKEIPAVMFNIDDISAEYKISFIQHLIDLSLKIYKMDSTLTVMQLQQGSGHLVIKTSENLPQKLAVGRGAIHVLKGETDSEQYVTPDTSGMNVIKETLSELKQEATSFMYSLKNIEGSGVSMVISLQSNTNSLKALVNIIGNAITRVIEKAGKLIDISEDQIDFIPYSDFGSISAYQETIETNKVVEEVNTNVDQQQQ